MHITDNGPGIPPHLVERPPRPLPNGAPARGVGCSSSRVCPSAAARRGDLAAGSCPGSHPAALLDAIEPVAGPSLRVGDGENSDLRDEVHKDHGIRKAREPRATDHEVLGTSRRRGNDAGEPPISGRTRSTSARNSNSRPGRWPLYHAATSTSSSTASGERRTTLTEQRAGSESGYAPAAKTPPDYPP